jgi:hypothetical protein
MSIIGSPEILCRDKRVQENAIAASNGNAQWCLARQNSHHTQKGFPPPSTAVRQKRLTKQLSLPLICQWITEKAYALVI